MKNGIGKGSLGFVPALAGKGVTTSGGAAPSRAPKAEIYVCSRHGKRWIPLGSHWGIHLPTLDPSEMPNFPRGCSAFLKSRPRPRWLLRSRPNGRFLPEPAVFLLKLLTIGWEPDSTALACLFPGVLRQIFWRRHRSRRKPPGI